MLGIRNGRQPQLDDTCRAILDDAAWHFSTDPAAHAAFVEQLAALAHHGERAMTTFLDHPAPTTRPASGKLTKPRQAHGPTTGGKTNVCMRIDHRIG